MNYRRRAMIISLVIHGSLLFLVFALSSSFAKSGKPVVIDFTLVEPNGPPPPPAEARKKQAETPAITKTRPIPQPPKQQVAPPEPATDPRGTVPVFAKPKESSPAPVVQPSPPAVNAVAGGTGASTGTHTAAGSGKGESTEQLRSRYRAEHFAYIKKIIEENLSYPPRAQRMGMSGRVVVAFEVLNNGRVQNIRIAKSTGYEILDDNVIDTIKKVEPFPRPPVPVKLTIPFSYGLE
jgi:protein TonB